MYNKYDKTQIVVTAYRINKIAYKEILKSLFINHDSDMGRDQHKNICMQRLILAFICMQINQPYTLEALINS